MEIKDCLRRKQDRIAENNLVRNGIFGAAIAADLVKRTIRKRQDMRTAVPSEKSLFIAQGIINTLIDLVNIAACAVVSAKLPDGLPT